MIPKILHFVWIGDDSKKPNNCIDTWRKYHPDWKVKVWGNESLENYKWINTDHMIEMTNKQSLSGVADLMRYEILFNEGGVAVDADSVCLKPLENDFIDNEAFSSWENESIRKGLISMACVGSVPNNYFFKKIITDIKNENSVIEKKAWQTVGPSRLSESYYKYKYDDLKIYPSYYFIPVHYTGLKYEGAGPVYANQLWGSTRGFYNKIYLRKF